MKRACAAAILAAAVSGCCTPVPFTSSERIEPQALPIRATPEKATIVVDGKALGETAASVEFQTRIRSRREWSTPFDPVLAIPWSVVVVIDFLVSQGGDNLFGSLDALARGKRIERREPILRDIEVSAPGHLPERRRIGTAHEARAFDFFLQPEKPANGMSPPPTPPGDPADRTP